jgi:hypothetical protein
MGKTCRTHRKKSAYRVLVGKPKGQSPLGRPRSELHKIPARVQCTVQCADWIDEPAPPTIP